MMADNKCKIEQNYKNQSIFTNTFVDTITF